MIYKEKWVRKTYFDFGTTVEKSGLLRLKKGRALTQISDLKK